ncbi:hypothetical protein BY996DRAFT_4573780 [Phakopsora pachyrhizi]|uniref:CST complex subunit STN1 n=1 Tax=Phakopsora pachyrhizi TaxID=170000 RepID=A0AAV0BRE1_PHAPC|nr:hypothetical protein BY996DRAFT_4573780 [Phakopsora pachyrhizi]CAH7689993.1 expressed protein [Phakopsora pachyrhizi]
MVEIQTGFQKLRNQRKLTQNHKGKQVWRADEDPGSSQSVYPLPKSLKHKNISSSLLKKIEFASSSSDPFEEKIDESPIEIIEIDSSSESSSDDELVESILLGRPPPTSTPNLILTSPSQSQPQSQSQSQPKRRPQPQHQPQPRFSPSDLRWMNVYFSKPVSTVLTTCSSLVVPPSAINGLPLDRLESLLAEDKWRIKREIISSPGNNQKIDCWVQADGWPAKTFKVCGWFVGVDRREKYLNYYVDDGTAVLECQISLSSAQSIFEERHTEKQSEEVLIYNSSHSKVHQNRDARLDAYIRPSSSPKKLSIQAPKEQQIKASEELIQKYANIMIGTTVQVTGQPKEMFRGLKRILEVESISFEDSNGEIKFRNELNKLRSTTYSQWPFRLSRAWPSFNSNYRECSISNGSSTFGNRTADFNVSVRSQPKHLRLPAARSLRLEQLNLPLFVTYLAHHINQNYIDKGKRTSGKQRISINELMKDPDLMEFAERLSNRLNPPTSQPAINIAGNSKFLNKQPQTARIRVNEPRRLFNKGIIKLVEQGVLIISVEDEKREEMFTLPDIYSLGPKLKELIQRNKAIRDLMVDDQLENGAGIDLILNDLKKDELWKYVTKDSVKSVLKQL